MSCRQRPIGDHAVGYGRPPVATRFKPGQSGNPSGRPKKTKMPLSYAAIVEESVLAAVLVETRGRKQKKKVSKLAVLMNRLSNEAARGIPGADEKLLRFMKVFPQRPNQPIVDEPFVDYGAQVRAKLEQMARRIAEEAKRSNDDQEAGQLEPPETTKSSETKKD